jgi:predicted DNA-binding protein (UPF0251 family)
MYKQLNEFEKNQAELGQKQTAQKKDLTAISKDELEMNFKKLEAINKVGMGPLQQYKAAIARGVSPETAKKAIQSSWQVAVSQLRNTGMFDEKFLASIPQQFDPDMVESQLAQTMKYSDVLNNEIQNRTLAETGRHNRVAETNTATTARETARHNRVDEGLSSQRNAISANDNAIKLSAKNTELTTSLRKEFNDLPDVKSFNIVQPIISSVRKAAKDNTGASDLDLIYGLGKVLDPNSVVREGELQLAADTGSLGEKIKGYYNKVATGGRLTKEIRADLLKTMERRTEGLKSSYDSARRRYTGIARTNKIDESQVFIDPTYESAPSKSGEFNTLPDAATFQKQHPGKTLKDSVTGKTMKPVNGQWVPQ